ncbi:hypothetical protein, partial [Microbispora hainanensis]
MINGSRELPQEAIHPAAARAGAASPQPRSSSMSRYGSLKWRAKEVFQNVLAELLVKRPVIPSASNNINSHQQCVRYGIYSGVAEKTPGFSL